MSEQWKVIDELDGRYFVSNYGRIKSVIETKKGTRVNILKTTPDSKGYHRIRISIKGVKKAFKVHRLVAKAFLDIPEGTSQANHIDGDKSNNRADNLEWVTNKQNAEHAIESGLWANVFKASRETNEKRKTPVCLTKGEEQLIFPSIAEAERFLGSRHITDVLNGRRKTVKGYTVCKAGDE